VVDKKTDAAKEVKHDPVVPIRRPKTCRGRTRIVLGRPAGFRDQSAGGLHRPPAGGAKREENAAETVNARRAKRWNGEFYARRAVTVSIGVPELLRRVTASGNLTEPAVSQDAASNEPTRSAELAAKHVAALLPPVEGQADQTQLVTVTLFQDITPGPRRGRRPGWLGLGARWGCCWWRCSAW
jgi:hypothetical protein